MSPELNDLVSKDYVIVDHFRNYGYTLDCLREDCRNDPYSLQPLDQRGRARPLSFLETAMARVEDYDTLQNPDGSERSLEERRRLWMEVLLTASHIAYKKKNLRIKIVQISPLLSNPSSDCFYRDRIPLPFPDEDLRCEDVDLKNPHSIFNRHLTSAEFQDHPYWRQLIPDKHYRQRFGEIIFQDFGLTTACKVPLMRESPSDQVFPLAMSAAIDGAGEVIEICPREDACPFLRITRKHA